jgi:lysozyme
MLTVRRFSPYAAGIVGPLPYLLPTSPVVPPAKPETPEAPIVVQAAIGTPDEESLAEPAAPETAPIHPPEGELVLTSPEDAPEPAMVRPVWPSEQRTEAESAEAGLFGEDMALTQGGGPVLRHEIEIEAPARFDWSETGAFIIMGAVGLTSFGAAMAAFRLASEQSGGGTETTVIAWVLAVIGGACVGVSSFNLYRRWGLPGGD